MSAIPAVDVVNTQPLGQRISHKLKPIIEKVKNFILDFWDLMVKTYKEVRAIVKFSAAVVVTAAKDGLSKAGHGLGLLFFPIVLKSTIEELPGKFKKINQNKELGDKEGTVRAGMDFGSQCVETTGDLLTAIDSVAKLAAFDIPGLNFVAAPLTILGLGYVSAKTIYDIYQHAVFLKDLKAKKNLSEYDIQPLEKNKLERRADKKVVQIIENLGHIDHGLKVKKIKQIMVQKIVLNSIDTVFNLALVASIIAGLIIGLPLLVIPIIVLAKATFSLIKAAVNHATDKKFTAWYDQKLLETAA